MTEAEQTQLIVSALKETGTVGLLAIFLYAVWGQLQRFVTWLMAQNDKFVEAMLDERKP